MKKILLTAIVFMCTIYGGQVWAEWVDVDRVVNGNTFVSASGETINIIGLSRTPEVQMTNFFFEDNDVWVDRKTIDDSGRTFAVIDLHGDISYSQIVDEHKYNKAADSVICLSSNKKYVCNGCKSHCKSPHPYSIPGARRIRGTALNHRKTWEEFYGTPVETVTIASAGRNSRSSYNSGGVGYNATGHNSISRGDRSQIRQLKGQIRRIDKKIANTNSSIDFNANLRNSRSTGGKRRESKGLTEQRRALQEQLNDLQLVGAGANPSWVMDQRRDTRNARLEREEMREIAREEASSAASSNKRNTPNIIMGEWDDKGSHYMPAGGGNAWRDDGTFMMKSGGGYLDTKSGKFIPVVK